MAAEKKASPNVESRLRHNILKMPQEVYQASGIVINGRRLKSFVFTTDLAIIRNCEAFGIQDIHTVETLCPFSPNTHIVKGTDKWIDLHRHADTAGALAALRGAGYRLIATTPHSGDTSPEAFDVSQSPFVLIFGTEHAGISDEVKAAADGFIRIPMCGFVESLNVSASAAILLSQLSSRLRAGNAPWRLSDDEQAALLFRWLMESIRDSQRILAHEFPE